MKEKIKAVLFDLDGTLIDSEKYYAVLWQELIPTFGYKITYENYLDLRELGQPYLDEYLKKNIGDICFSDIKSKFDEKIEELINEHKLELKKGVEEVLQFLKNQNIKMSIVTAGDCNKASRILKYLDIYDYFEDIIGGANAKVGKPSPDLFLYACEKINVQPKECIVVEDAPNGVIAGYSAGCKVIMIPDVKNDKDKIVYNKATKVLDSMEELDDFLLTYLKN